jgi:hypothetical protein
MVWITIALGVGLLLLLICWFIANRLPPEPDIDDE